MPSRNRMFDKQAFAILRDLYKNLVGQDYNVPDFASYVTCFEKLKDFYTSDDAFQHAVYDNMFLKVGKVVWASKPEVADPFNFVSRPYAELSELMVRGYVFERDIEERAVADEYYLEPKLGDTGVDLDKLTRLEGLKWKGKDYPTEVRGTINRFHARDALNYYRLVEVAQYDPYSLYNMYAQIKKAWLQNFNNWRKQWNRVAFYNMVFSTVKVPSTVTNAPRVIKLLTEYNAKYGKQLTSSNWFLEGNIEHFAKWAYIRINEVIRIFGYDSNEYMTDNTINFRGKNYEYHYGVTKPATAFLHEPFLLMKSYSDADTFNENDLANVSVNYVDFWDTFRDKWKLRTSSYMDFEDGKWVRKEENVTIDNMLGIIYDADSIGSASFNERSYDTGYNEVTEHGVLHIHCDFANFYNPMLKAVAIMME